MDTTILAKRIPWAIYLAHITYFLAQSKPLVIRQPLMLMTHSFSNIRMLGTRIIIKKASCTITAATMHFYLLYNWIIFFICHARIQKAFSWLIPWHNLKENRNVIWVITSVPRTTCSLEYLFKLTWFLSVVICLVCFLKECMCLHNQVPNTPQSWPTATKFKRQANVSKIGKFL